MFLDRIVASVEGRVQSLKPRTGDLLAALAAAPAPRPLAAALKTAAGNEKIGLIAECKHRSPSKGWLTDHYDPVHQALTYQAFGATAVSVLTEPEFFAGHLDHLTKVREAVGLPVLRKDFVRDPVQLVEARAAGADAALVIVRIIEDQARLQDLFATAADIGLEVLTEIHRADELDRALSAGARLIGVNNRDLDSFVTRLDFSGDIAPHLPKDIVAVSESGIQQLTDVEQVRAWGYQAILVGEALMRGGALLEALREWRSR